MSLRTRLDAKLQRARVVLADRAYPGGLVAHSPAPVEVAVPYFERPQGAAIIDVVERSVEVEHRLHGQGPLYRDLAKAITDDDLAELDRRVTDEERRVLEQVDPIARRVLAASLAVHHGMDEVAERTNLSAATPPETVHAMNYVSWGTGGDAGYADMIDNALRDAGTPMVAGTRVLDYGCSSGRVVRMLAARLPEVDFHGCDVNGDAVAWADSALPGITFASQPLRPPLPYPADHFDAAYAISIWSHYAADPALTWLGEMRRVIRLGGSLLITTHGSAAIAFRAADPRHGPDAQAPILEGLYRDGFVFVDSFGSDGDWGVVDSGWGASFMTPEWLLAQITPEWSVQLYRPGGIEGHQDLYVLRREL